MEVLDQWMKSCSGQSTWRELADHLSKIGKRLAKELMTSYEIAGEYAISGYDNGVDKSSQSPIRFETLATG